MLPGALTAKLGPLPAWAWGLLVGVGVLGYAYLHRSSSTTAAADQAAADSTGADTTGAGTDAGTPSDLSTIDSTAPLDFAGPTSGYANATPNVPQSLRIDPAQWKRLQAEIRQLRREERRDAQRAPKHKRKTATTKQTPTAHNTTNTVTPGQGRP